MGIFMILRSENVSPAAGRAGASKASNRVKNRLMCQKKSKTQGAFWISLAICALTTVPAGAEELRPDFQAIDYHSPDHRRQIKATVPEELKTGDQLPEHLPLLDSMNNVDLIRHGLPDGSQRYYLAFRTAPSHFASTETLLHVLSSACPRPRKRPSSSRLSLAMNLL